jgi:hypothetical protein
MEVGNEGMRDSDLDNQREIVGKYLDFFSLNKNKTIAPNTGRYNSKKDGYKKQGTILLDDVTDKSTDDDDDDDDDDDNDDSSDSGKDKKDKKIKNLRKNLLLTENDEEVYLQVKSLIDYGRYKKACAFGFNKKSKLSNFIDINN